MADKFHSSGPIFNDLVEFFTGDEWSPEQIEDQPVLKMDFEGDNGKWTCLAFAYDERERLVFASVLPVDIPEEKRAVAAEYITRANFGMEIGNFEMDYSDGSVQFRTSVDIEGGELTPKMIQNLAYVNVTVTDQYLPGLVMVLEGDATPEEAIEKVESSE
ncbi:MAG: YbjN domain-containing protein [Saprospiraceae bacterium]|nr:YbjN domain-containing protein [Saprospiraceae bacterium]